jgi:hypothetical protein
MNRPTQIHRGKQPRRPHFIPEWAEKRGYATQAELVKASGADKGLVSKWYSGSSPGVEWQEKLAFLFKCDETDSIFRHPDDDWLSRFFRNRDPDEIERMKQTLELTFPIRKSAGK